MNNKSQRYGVDTAACKKQDWQTRLLLAGNKLQAPQQRIKLEERKKKISTLEMSTTRTHEFRISPSNIVAKMEHFCENDLANSLMAKKECYKQIYKGSKIS